MVILGPVRRVQHRLADKGGDLRIMPLERAKHPAQETQFFVGNPLAPLDAALNRVIRLGQGRIVLKGANPPGQAKQVIDLDRVELHRRRRGEPQGAGLRAQGLTDRPVKVPVLGLHHQSGRRVAAPGIVSLVDQGDVPGLRRQLPLAVFAPDQPGGDDDTLGCKHRLGRNLFLHRSTGRMQIGVPDRGAGERPAEAQEELGCQFALPLPGQACRRCDQHPSRQPGQDQRAQGQARFDRLAQAHLVAQQKAVGVGGDQPPRHNGLMGPGLHRGRGHPDEATVGHPRGLAQDREFQPLPRGWSWRLHRTLARPLDLLRCNDGAANLDQALAHRLGQVHHVEPRVLVLPDGLEVGRVAVGPGCLAGAPPIAVHPDVLGVDQQRRARLVQGPLGDESVALRVLKDGPFLVDIAVLARIIGDGHAGLAMTAQRHADRKATLLQHPGQ